MDYENLKNVLNYPDIYERLAVLGNSLSELRKDLRIDGIAGGNMSRRNVFLAGDPPFISIEDDIITYDKEAFRDYMHEVMDNLIGKDLNEGNLKNRIRELEDMLREKDGIIQKMKTEAEDLEKRLLKAEIEQKVMVASTLTVGPKEKAADDIFLVDPERYLDVDACVAKYGGILDSFYKEMPTDEKEPEGFEPGHELNGRNHNLRIMNTVGTKRFLQKRADDIKEAKEIEKETGKLFPDSVPAGKPCRIEARDRILRNRAETMNHIIKCDRLTNQEKLMLYAMNSFYTGTRDERLLCYAGQHCINADFFIYIMMDPNVCQNYEETIWFLDQFADASEFRMKLNLARELIEGKWYIKAEYKGKETKFQLVPIEEFNELRERAGLPVSEFGYKGKGAAAGENAGDSGSFPGVDFHDIADSMINIPDDGYRMPELDDDYPY